MQKSSLYQTLFIKLEIWMTIEGPNENYDECRIKTWIWINPTSKCQIRAWTKCRMTTIGKQTHLTSILCDMILALNYNLFSGWPHRCSSVNTLCPVSKRQQYLWAGAGSAFLNHLRMGTAWPRKKLLPQFNFLARKYCRTIVWLTQIAHYQGVGAILLSENLTMGRLSSL